MGEVLILLLGLFCFFGSLSMGDKAGTAVSGLLLVLIVVLMLVIGG